MKKVLIDSSILGSNKEKYIKTKEELYDLIKQYSGILNTSTIHYLEYLIELKTSVVKDCISRDDRKSLSELGIYKKVMSYNLYNMIFNLAKEYNNTYKLDYYDDNRGLYIKLDGINVIDYIFNSVNDDDNNNKITLYQTIEDKEILKDELDRVLEELDKLYDMKNPYLTIRGIVGGPGDLWENERITRINYYKKLLKQLDPKKELTEREKKEIEITKGFHEEIFKLFETTSDSFELIENNKYGSFSSHFNETPTKLEKTLIKVKPGLVIKDSIKYV